MSAPARPHLAVNSGRHALVERLRKARGWMAPEAPPPIARRPSGPAPLSAGQERLWFLDRLEPGNWAYVICSVMRAPVALRPHLLEQAVNAIVARHETLRSNFDADDDGRPRLCIAADRRIALDRRDLSHIEASDRLAEAMRLAGEMARTPFDLAADPLLRVSLLRLAAADHVVVVAVHHIVSDAWSMDLFFAELFELYNAGIMRRQPELPGLPVSYSDFAAWQRAELAGPRRQRLLEYWQRQLAGAPPLLPLPSDHPRPAVRSGAGGRSASHLDAAVLAPLRALAAAAGATQFMALLAVFFVLLWRLCGMTQLVVGTPNANRNRSELEPLIGFFVNTLVLHVDLAGDPDFHQVLARVREVALGAAAHQDLPFDTLVEHLAPPRSRAHNPIFQVLFNLQNGLRPPSGSAAGPQGAEPALHHVGAPKFDMEWALREHVDGIALTVEYSADLFEPATVEAMAGDYRDLLARLGAQPQLRLSQLAAGVAPGQGADFDFGD